MTTGGDAMKFKLIIDKQKDEEVVATVHQRSALTDEIEALILGYTGTDRIPAYTEDEIKMLDSIQYDPTKDVFKTARNGSFNVDKISDDIFNPDIQNTINVSEANEPTIKLLIKLKKSMDKVKEKPVVEESTTVVTNGDQPQADVVTPDVQVGSERTVDPAPAPTPAPTPAPAPMPAPTPAPTSS